jgi:VIT1/CCC1 family predicted Fe2+/Mn2+ transporter
MAHIEKHFTASETIKDIVIGMSDGLTVPFALAAGLSGAVSSTNIVITAGLAEIAAGAIAMGLGGYLAAKSEMEHYTSERQREEREVVEVPQHEEQEILDIMKEYGVNAEESMPLLNALKRNPTAWVDFMMKFELGLEPPDPKRSLYSALTIGGSYILGGIIPLLPYEFSGNVREGLYISVGVTLLALLIFGYFKGSFTSKSPLKSAFETMIIGGFAAAAAFLIAKAIS